MILPRLVVSGLSGGSGKTTVSLGLTRALVRQGVTVAPFKKGPDYTDTAWLALAAGRRAANLDPFFFSPGRIREHFARYFVGAGIGIVEGNRGFFDGRDLSGSCSTAQVAAALDAPVVLVVDITKMTRTTAALVAGCKKFPGGERIAGVILNRSGGPRHAEIACRAVEELAGTKVFGVLPRLDSAPIFERRAGLATAGETCGARDTLNAIADFISDNVDIEAVLALSRSAPALATPVSAAPVLSSVDASSFGDGGAPVISPVRIGIVRDEALWQYYDENLEALRHAGAELVFVSLLDETPWPEMGGLYLGGGDLGPHILKLAENITRKEEITTLIESGMPVYAEHSGYFYLGRIFVRNGTAHEMAGVFPVTATVTEKPARLGYMEARLEKDAPFYAAGYSLKGHEYHYADIAVGENAAASLHKTANERRIEVADGLVYKSAFGTSMQIFAPAVPDWAESFVRAARAWKKE